VLSIFVIKNQQGFALPLVIGISAVILIIIMTISDSVIRKIGVVSELDNYCRADLKAYSAFNETIFSLLTSTFTPTGMQVQIPGAEFSSGQLPEKETRTFWNLYGEPIEIEGGVHVVLQDTAGLVSPVFSSDILRRLIADAAPEYGSVFMDSLADWQDGDEFRHLNGAERWDYRQAGFPYGPRNSYVQCLQELSLINGMNENLFQRVKNELIYWPAGNTNYLTMSPDLLQLILNKKDPEGELVRQLMSLRHNHQLTPVLFSALTGIKQGEYDYFYPSGKVKLTIMAEVKTAQSHIEAVVAKRSTPTRPYTILEWRR